MTKTRPAALSREPEAAQAEAPTPIGYVHKGWLRDWLAGNGKAPRICRADEVEDDDDSVAVYAAAPAPAGVVDERAEFEAWAVEKNYAYRNKHGLWFYDWSAPLWAGWKGRAARAHSAKGV